MDPNNANIEADIECVSRFRNESGKLVMPSEVDDRDIYMYLGHGGDICDDNGDLVIKTVPDNCIYITQTVCGLINRMGSDSFKLFADPAYAHVWRDPIAHIDEFKNMFPYEMRPHIHMPGCSYVDNYFYPVSVHGEDIFKPRDGIDTDIAYSGLMNLETALGMTDEERKLFEIATFTPQITKIDPLALLNESLPTPYIRKLFSKSVYPPFPNYKSATMPAIYMNILGQARRKRVSELMEEFPGVHFNLLCRSIKEERCQRAVTRRRRQSAVVQNTVANTARKMMSVENDSMRDEKVVDYIESVYGYLLRDGDLPIIEVLIKKAKEKAWRRATYLFQQIYSEIAVRKFMEQVQINSNATEAKQQRLKQFLDTLDSDEIKGQTGAALLAIAFNSDMRYLVRYLCKKGAPKNRMRSEFRAIKKFAGRQLYTRKFRLIRECSASSRKAKRLENEDANNANSYRSN